jgi:hypothetical protein
VSRIFAALGQVAKNLKKILSGSQVSFYVDVPLDFQTRLKASLPKTTFLHR